MITLAPLQKMPAKTEALYMFEERHCDYYTVCGQQNKNFKPKTKPEKI